jgi:hypothetical protein
MLLPGAIDHAKPKAITTMTDTNAAIELTDTIVRKATVPEGKAEVYLKDAKQGGFALRLRSSGGKSFVFLTTRPGRKGTHTVTIGPVGTFNVAAARKQAAILAGRRTNGADLIEDKRKQKQAAKKAANLTTLGALIGPPKDGEEDNCPYAVARRDRERIANWRHELGYLRRNLLADHRDVDIRDVSRRDVTVAMTSSTRPVNAARVQGCGSMPPRSSAGRWSKVTSTSIRSPTRGAGAKDRAPKPSNAGPRAAR